MEVPAGREAARVLDHEIRRLALRDRRAAVDALHRVHAGAVMANLYLMLRDAESARDLCQETFVRAFVAESLFGSDVPFRPWLLKVASRLALNFVRARKRRDRREAAASPAPVNDPLEEVLRRQTHAELHQGLVALPIAYRQPLVLHYHEGMSCEEIARVLDLAPGTVMSRLFRARLLLRRKMR